VRRPYEIISLDLELFRAACGHSIRRHLGPKVGPLECKDAPVVVTPSICSHCNRAQAKEGCLSIKKRFMVRVGVATLIDIKEEHLQKFQENEQRPLLEEPLWYPKAGGTPAEW